MMMPREEILMLVDELLERYQPYTEDNLGWFGIRLEELFDGETAPYVPDIQRVRYLNGKVVATIRAPFELDADEWCAALQDFVEGRFDVEPVDTRA